MLSKGNGLDARDLSAAQRELVKIIHIFTNESLRYFTDIEDISVFTNIFLSICRIIKKKKKGLQEDSISEELQKLVTKNYSSNLTKTSCYRAVNWLYQSGIIGYCGKIIEMDILPIKNRPLAIPRMNCLLAASSMNCLLAIPQIL